MIYRYERPDKENGGHKERPLKGPRSRGLPYWDEHRGLSANRPQPGDRNRRSRTLRPLEEPG